MVVEGAYALMCVISLLSHSANDQNITFTHSHFQKSFYIAVTGVVMVAHPATAGAMDNNSLHMVVEGELSSV